MKLSYRYRLLLIIAGLCCSGCTLGPGAPSAPAADPWQAGTAWRHDPVRQVASEERLLESEPKQYALENETPKKLVDRTKQLTGLGEKPNEARQKWAEAEALYQQASQSRDPDTFLQAARTYERAGRLWPGSQLEEDALFLVGESYYFADHYPAANNAYERLLARYPNTRYLDVAEARRFATAEYWLALEEQDAQSFFAVNMFDDKYPLRDRAGHALRIFDRIRIDDPTGKLADDATLAYANEYFAAGKYAQADQLYTDLRKNFPRSEHQFTAHLLGLQAKLASYQGPDYSGEPLDGAEQILKQIHRQFPDKAAQEREYLSRAYARIRYSNAEREWTRAQYYERRNRYQAARYHYDLIAKDFADTPFQPRATERLQALGGKPPTDPQRMQWLVNLFPDGQPEDPLIASGASPLRR